MEPTKRVRNAEVRGSIPSGPPINSPQIENLAAHSELGQFFASGQYVARNNRTKHQGTVGNGNAC